MEDLSNFENGKQEEYSNSIPQQDVIQTLYSITYNNSLMQMVELYKILILLSLNQK